jgi:hypothetical protein
LHEATESVRVGASKLHHETIADFLHGVSGATRDSGTEMTMRFTTRGQKNRRRSRGPRIAISQDEITADLQFRGGEPRRAGTPAPLGRGRR